MQTNFKTDQDPKSVVESVMMLMMVLKSESIYDHSHLGRRTLKKSNKKDHAHRMQM